MCAVILEDARHDCFSQCNAGADVVQSQEVAHHLIARSLGGSVKRLRFAWQPWDDVQV